MELVGCEDEEAGNPDVLASWVVHKRVNLWYNIIKERECRVS
uniref:Uncharacterized protein n=1 Tax=Siphoviridae sp. ctnpt50 TaxID=2827941 RepID=A0A8S5SDK7_9CAUD|nr:MAG TPA: hypothetical protein [Siphoviridae sp. ctnpt50]